MSETKLRIFPKVVALVSDDTLSSMIKSIYLPNFEASGIRLVRPSVKYYDKLFVQHGEGSTYFNEFGIKILFDTNELGLNQRQVICVNSGIIQDFADDGFAPEYILVVYSAPLKNNPAMSKMLTEKMKYFDDRKLCAVNARDPNSIYSGHAWISSILSEMERNQNEPQRKA